MSQRDSGYARQPLDNYPTPAWVTAALIPHLPPMQRIWEPACGSGKMVTVLGAHGYSMIATDVDTGTDFLKETDHRYTEAIITNPPYELATEFIEKSLELMRPVDGLVAMLLRTDFDHAKTRQHLFGQCPRFAKKLVLTKRIVWFEQEPGKPKAAPSFNHAWYIWNYKHTGPPTLGYGP